MESLTNEVLLFKMLERPSLPVSVATMACVVGILAYFRDQKDLVKQSLIILFIITATVALFFFTDRYDLYRHRRMVPGRYMLIASFFWVMLLMAWLEKWIIRRHLIERAKPMVIAACIALVVPFNVARYENFSFPRGQKRGKAISTFVKAIKFYEGEAERWRERYIVLRLGKNRRVRRFQPTVRIGSRLSSAVNVRSGRDVGAMPFQQFIVRSPSIP